MLPCWQRSSHCLWTLNRQNFRWASSLVTDYGRSPEPTNPREDKQLYALLQSGICHKAHNATKCEGRDHTTAVCCGKFVRRKNSMIDHAKELITSSSINRMNVTVTHYRLLLLRTKCVMLCKIQGYAVSKLHNSSFSYTMTRWKAYWVRTSCCLSIHYHHVQLRVH
jgi:hypothetical protein